MVSRARRGEEPPGRGWHGRRGRQGDGTVEEAGLGVGMRGGLGGVRAFLRWNGGEFGEYILLLCSAGDVVEMDAYSPQGCEEDKHIVTYINFKRGRLSTSHRRSYMSCRGAGMSCGGSWYVGDSGSRFVLSGSRSVLRLLLQARFHWLIFDRTHGGNAAPSRLPPLLGGHEWN